MACECDVPGWAVPVIVVSCLFAGCIAGFGITAHEPKGSTSTVGAKVLYAEQFKGRNQVTCRDDNGKTRAFTDSPILPAAGARVFIVVNEQGDGVTLIDPVEAPKK